MSHYMTCDEEGACFIGDLGLILDKTMKLEWHRTNNTRTRCLRITQKVGCILLCLPYCIICPTSTWLWTEYQRFVCLHMIVVGICHVRYMGWQASVYCMVCMQRHSVSQPIVLEFQDACALLALVCLPKGACLTSKHTGCAALLSRDMAMLCLNMMRFSAATSLVCLSVP